MKFYLASGFLLLLAGFFFFPALRGMFRPHSVTVFAEIHDPIRPLERADKYEEPLTAALKKNGYGKVYGGGTMQAKDGSIEYVGVDMDLTNLKRGVPFVSDFLASHGAPQGSVLQYKLDGKSYEVPIEKAK